MKANAAREQREARAALMKVGGISRCAKEDRRLSLGSVCMWGRGIRSGEAGAFSCYARLRRRNASSRENSSYSL